MANKQLHFITGIGRSGTTLLSTLLNNHPAIHALPEASFIVFFIHALGHKKTITRSDIDEIFDQIELYGLTHPWVGWDFDAQKVKQDLLSRLQGGEEMDFESLCTHVYAQFQVRGMDKENAGILLNKNPGTTLFLEQIFDVFPDSKFILMVRDYRGNVLSRKQTIYMKTPNVVFNAFRWRWMTKRALAFKKAHPDRVIVVRYEDLTADPESELRKICDFFQLPLSMDLLRPNHQFDEWNEVSCTMPGIKTYADNKFADLATPVNQKRTLAWQKELSREEIIACDVVCSKTGAKFGYAPFYKIGKLQYLLLKLKLAGYSIFTSLYMNKEVWVNYLSPRLKLWRLWSIYKKHGFRPK
jgi:hypothetical protein